MNIVSKSEFNFKGVQLSPVNDMGSVWFTSADLAAALKYKSTKSITNLFNQNNDEFSDGMTQVIESVTSGNYRKKVRVFSLRGAHLIAMFARTDVAKEFRRWVLGILDREVEHSPIAKQFTDQELCDLAWLWRAGAVMITACRDIYPLLKVAEHRQAGHFYSIGQGFTRTLNKGREIIKRETSHIEFQPWRDDNWSRVLPHLRQEMLQ
ncbi:P22AR C-terminal domain-containing protein [Enterobacter sp. RHBSTW-00318]|uniref:P22AR C-terminal domain-containing protein n=1 Tax=Enterobacter sp. RHBSTW-00318 TaxID=2742643 RepID=UPI0031F98154